MTTIIIILSLTTMAFAMLYAGEARRNHRLKQANKQLSKDLKKAYEIIEDLELNPKQTHYD